MNVKRCETCLMPSTAFNLTDNGCDYCNTQNVQNKSCLTLEDIQIYTKKSTGKYDCLVPISGGRDSSYVLYYVKKIMGLNPLSVNFNNGFVTGQALKNMQNCTDALGVDFISYSFSNKFFHKLQSEFFKKTGEFCSPCNAAKKYVSKKIALQNGIAIIIRGNSTSLDNNNVDKDFHSIFDNGIDNFENLVSEFADNKEKEHYNDFINMSEWGNDIKYVELPNIINWDFHKINEILVKECGWNINPETFYHKDCQLLPLLYFLQYKKYGYSDQQLFLSNLIKYKNVSKDSILHLFDNNEVTEIPKDLEFLLSKLNVNINDFRDVAKKHWNLFDQLG
jgi:hypothetical protein